MRIIKLLALSLMLSSCASIDMNHSFSCGIGEGLGCRSVSEVSDIVEASDISGTQIEVQSSKDNEAFYSMISYYEQAENDKIPEREPEKRIRIWFAPHIDTYDNFVEETVVYSVIKESHWKW